MVGRSVSRVRNWARAWVDLIDERLQAFLFLLMCLGLMLASAFLWLEMISGDNWVMVCGILFGSNAVGGGISQLGRSRSGADSGAARPA